MRLSDPTASLRDFADTAALIANLDLVVSVDTAVVHLAGAMGKPVFLLDRYDNCWRWLTGRTDSPWYPDLTIFRQSRPGDWAGPMAGAAAALQAMALYRGAGLPNAGRGPGLATPQTSSGGRPGLARRGRSPRRRSRLHVADVRPGGGRVLARRGCRPGKEAPSGGKTPGQIGPSRPICLHRARNVDLFS